MAYELSEGLLSPSSKSKPSNRHMLRSHEEKGSSTEWERCLTKEEEWFEVFCKV